MLQRNIVLINIFLLTQKILQNPTKILQTPYNTELHANSVNNIIIAAPK